MTKRAKLFEKIKRSPHNTTFDQLRKLLQEEEFYLDRVSGSHHVFIKGDIVFAVPVHNNRVKSVYVKRLVEIIEEHGRG